MFVCCFSEDTNAPPSISVSETAAVSGEICPQTATANMIAYVCA